MKYHSPATPFERLRDNPPTPLEVARRVGTIYMTLSPICLLRDIRARQQRLANMGDTPMRMANATNSPPTIKQFSASLRRRCEKASQICDAAEAESSARTSKVRSAGGGLHRDRRLVRRRAAADLTQASDRLQSAYLRKYSGGHLRKLQRCLKYLPRKAAHNLVVGLAQEAAPNVTIVPVRTDRLD